MSKIGLGFLENTGGESEGLSESGIETFRDRPFAAVARETGQNSRDARLDPSKPVRVTFDVVTMKSAELPSIAEFRAAARLCLEKSKKIGKEKEKGFFEHAVKALEATTIDVLKISDSNTKGARGPCEEGKPFHTLAKTEGSSTKEDLNSGGSYGIGKNAVFAISDIHTAFFSTCYEGADGKDHHLCMGKTLFISHRDAGNTERRRKGYWGKLDGYMPLDNPKEIPAWMLREERGTSIFSVCMRQNKIDWRYEMAAAIIINFFCAIERQEMEFEIDKRYLRINRNTLQSLFRDSNILDAVKKLNLGVAFEAAKTLHTCLIDEKAIIRDLDDPVLGKVQLRVLLRDGLGYTIGIIRNGMYITDNFAHFNEPFKRFPLHREFAIVVEPMGQVAGEWFKRLEGPKHDDLSAERISDPALRDKGQRAFEALAKQIRDQIRALAKAEPTSAMELEELNDFFASEAAREEDDNATETDPKALKPVPVKKAPPKKKTASAKKTDDDDEDVVPGMGPGPLPGDEPGGGGGGGGGGDNPVGPDPRPRGRRAARPIDLEGERNLIPDSSRPHQRRLYFTAPAAGQFTLQFEATGLSSADRLTVVDVSGGSLQDGFVQLVCKKGERASVDVEFDTAYAGPIEMSAFVAPVEEAA
jgi:hypothetical protein